MSVAALLDDITPSQIRALSFLIETNDDRGTPHTDWVQRDGRRIHRGSIDALARRGLVSYNRYFGSARITTAGLDVARQAHNFFTRGPAR